MKKLQSYLFFVLIAFRFGLVNAQVRSVEEEIKKMIISDYQIVLNLYGLGSAKSDACIESIEIDSSYISAYKVNVLFGCDPLYFNMNQKHTFEYWISRGGNDFNTLYRINGFFISDFFENGILNAYAFFDEKTRKKIRKYLRRRDFDKIAQFFYCNQLLYFRGLKKNDRVFSRPIFIMSEDDRYGI
jgi:hypothetical protein